MTLKEKLLSLLDEKGIASSDADQILERYLNHGGESVRERLNDNASNYSPEALTSFWMLLSLNAARWMDENCPEHSARPFFDT